MLADGDGDGGAPAFFRPCRPSLGMSPPAGFVLYSVLLYSSTVVTGLRFTTVQYCTGSPSVVTLVSVCDRVEIYYSTVLYRESVCCDLSVCL